MLSTSFLFPIPCLPHAVCSAATLFFCCLPSLHEFFCRVCRLSLAVLSAPPSELRPSCALQEFRLLTKEQNINFSKVCTSEESQKPSEFVQQYQKFLRALTQAGTSQALTGKEEDHAAPMDLIGLMGGDTHTREKTWKEVCRWRRERARFLALRTAAGGDKADKEVFATGGPLTKLWQKSAGWVYKEKNRYTAILMCADTFNMSHMTVTENLHRVPVPVTPDVGLVLGWLGMHGKGDNIVIMMLDGRSRTCRRKLESFVEDHFCDSTRHAEIWITYSGSPQGTDLREAKRKVAFSDTKQEVLLAGFPVSKTKLKSKDRSHYTACGEHTTHHLTYSSVQPRHLDTLPRVSTADKERIVGGSLKPVAPEVADRVKNGQPLFWQEYKTVELWSNLFHDFDIGRVFDLSPGSGTAAVAAMHNDIGYEGVGANEAHCEWLDTLMDRTAVGFLADDKRKTCSGELCADISRYFATAVLDARRVMHNAHDVVEPAESDAEECSENEAGA